jgi:hypothetical protein
MRNKPTRLDFGTTLSSGEKARGFECFDVVVKGSTQNMEQKFVLVAAN